MSYPPRPPMGMPPMMGQPHGYGYAPMGMMPMQMGMMPMMQQPPPVNQNNIEKKNKLVPQEIPKKEDKKEEKPPVTTVFVGNISDRAPDAMIRQMLQRCGNVLSWKRVQGASGKLQAFGFCEYESPEATLRAIRLLHNWTIPDKRLVVKVDAKTKSLLDDWGRKKKKESEDDKKKEDGEIVEEKEESSADELDEFTLREDRVAKAGLDAIMREYAADIEKEMPPGEEEPVKDDKPKRPKKEKQSDGPKDLITKRNLGLEDMELEDDKKEIINREIRSFRDAYKEDEEEPDKRADDRGGDSRRQRRDMVDRDRERERERQREREREMRERETREREREAARERRERMNNKQSRSRSRERMPPVAPPSSSSSRMADPVDEEEEHERRKMERKLRDKEMAYQELLKKWEQRERKKAREYEKEQDREEDRKSEENKEGRRLKEFLEDYDDERDDPKYYKGGALQRRMKEREKEMEADDRDRQREKEEIEELRNKLTEEGHSDVEGEVAKLESERDAHLMPRLQNKSPTPESSPPSSPEPIRPSSTSKPLGFHGAIPEAAARMNVTAASSNGVPPAGGHRGAGGHHHQQPPPPEEDDSDSDSKSGIIIPPSSSSRHHSQDTHISGGGGAGGMDSDSSNDAQVMDNGGGDDRDDDDEDSRSPLQQSSRHRRSQSQSQSSSQFYNHRNNGPQHMQQSAEEVMQTVYKGFQGVGGAGDTGMSNSQPHNESSSSSHQPSAAATAAANKRKKLTREEVFNMDEDEDSNDGGLKKRKLVPLDYSEEEKKPSASKVPTVPATATAPAIVKPTTAEEKRKCIKNLIERIPTAKEELFAYKLDWTMVDANLMDRRIRPWVNKKIVEYIGEEEPTLSDFICQKVMGHCLPHTILSDIAMVLDEEAEVFVVKMWRLLIYETEAKKLGLVK